MFDGYVLVLITIFNVFLAVLIKDLLKINSTRIKIVILIPPLAVIYFIYLLLRSLAYYYFFYEKEKQETFKEL